MPDELEIFKRKEPKSLVCKKCRRRMKQDNRCLCRPWICFRCCECGLDCDLCGCSHKKRKETKNKT